MQKGLQEDKKNDSDFTLHRRNQNRSRFLCIQQDNLAVLGGFKIWWLITERDVVVDERSLNGVFPIGKNKSHLAIALGNDRHRAQVVYVDIARAKEVVERMHKYTALVVTDSKLAILLKHLMKLDVLLIDPFHIALKLLVYSFRRDPYEIGHHHQDGPVQGLRHLCRLLPEAGARAR